MAGTLYVVATPIGNLEDITYRAVRTLKEADLVACEDTRQTRKLLDHYGMRKPVVSYHEHNEASRTEELTRKLRDGLNIALVTDAGTPLVSDPGYRLVREAVAAGIPVVPIPGPSAALAALAASGLPTDSFRFLGFLPAKAGQREGALEKLRDEQATVILYESPHRIVDTLEAIGRVLGDRPLAIGREITKLHEEFLRGSAKELLALLRERASIKGEITIVMGKPEAGPADRENIRDAIEASMRDGLSRMDAIKQVARSRGLPKREVYRFLEERNHGEQ